MYSRFVQLTISFLACLVLMPCACAPLRLPRIDPTGRQIFLPAPNYTTSTLGGFNRDLFPPQSPERKLPIESWNQDSIPGLPQPVYTTPAVPPPCPQWGDPTIFGPSQISPSAPLAWHQAPKAPRPWFSLNYPTTKPSADNLVLTPQRVVAPIGTEVVLLAGVCREDQFFDKCGRIEWMLSQESVGHFIDVGDQGYFGLRHLTHPHHKKKTIGYAVAKALRRDKVLTRGTPNPADDVQVLSGQSWLSLTSPSEGISHVTAYAPDIKNWHRRQKSTTVHWIDAQWIFPPPTMGRIGSEQEIVTTVVQHTNSTPLPGWIVRYQIVGGVNAGFSPDGVQQMEVITNAQGQAPINVIANCDQPGPTHINVQVIQPNPTSGGPNRFVLGQGTTSIHWSAPSLAIQTTGPDIASVDTTATYRIDVSNLGDLPATNVQVQDTLPSGLEFLNSSPAAKVFGKRLEWQLGDLGPQSLSTIVVHCRTRALGEIKHCASTRSDNGLTARSCTTTRVFAVGLSVNVKGPRRALVGDRVQFSITVTNRGATPLTGIVLRDTFDPGLRHDTEQSPMERSLRDLQPGESISDLGVTFTVLSPGKHCHTLQVTANDGHTASDTACVTANAKPSQPQPALEVSKVGPKRKTVGEFADFTITIVNTGEAPLHQVTIVDQYDPLSLRPVNPPAGELTWTIPQLAQGETFTQQVRCQCIARHPHCCNLVSVQTREGIQHVHEACLQIDPAPPEPDIQPDRPFPAPENQSNHQPLNVVMPITSNGTTVLGGPLKLTVSTGPNRVYVNDRITMLISIDNQNVLNDRNVQTTLLLPVGAKFVGISGDLGIQRIDHDERIIEIEPIAEMRPGGKRSIRLEAEVSNAGRLPFYVRINSLRTKQAFEQRKDIHVQAR